MPFDLAVLPFRVLEGVPIRCSSDADPVGIVLVRVFLRLGTSAGATWDDVSSCASRVRLGIVLVV